MTTPKVQLPVYSWREKISGTTLVYIRDRDEADKEVGMLKPGPVGFDMEWKPTFVRGYPENPTALVQIANKDKILLIQVSAMTSFPERLQALLDDPNVIKAGVNIAGDCKKLYNDYNIPVRSCVELSYLARCVDLQWAGGYGTLISLARLVQAYEQRSLPKGRVQLSNWESKLSAEQQEYAANDSHSGLMVYSRLQAMAALMIPVPPASSYSFDVICGRPQRPSGRRWTPQNPRQCDPLNGPTSFASPAQAEPAEGSSSSSGERGMATPSASEDALGAPESSSKRRRGESADPPGSPSSRSFSTEDVDAPRAVRPRLDCGN